MVRYLWLFATFAASMTAVAAQRLPRDLEPGVSQALAEERAARVSNLRYEVHFTIPESQLSPVLGRVRVQFDLKNADTPLALDFVPGRKAPVTGSVNGDDKGPAYVSEHLVIPAHQLKAGPNEIVLEFTAGDAPLNRNPEFLYALFVPARARQAFPCFDQPDLKARYRLTLDVPNTWEAITNGAEVSRVANGATRTITFAETQPIPTYLFTFAAGKFQVETASRGTRSFRMLHRETDAQKVARNRDAVFDLHAAALDGLENYTGIPYPFGKFEFLLVPSFQFGGMEHPGSIFYNASALLLDPSATQNQKLGRASLIAHETAHMWFGDLVTMKWFNDVWMKEVFANFMAAKIVNPSFPEVNHDLRFLYSHYPAAYGVDRTRGSNAIRQRLANLTEAGSLYGAIIYQKAPIVMRQLEMTVGVDGLREGLRQYLKAHAFGNATWSDLISVLDPRTPENLADWSRVWVEEEGRPHVSTELQIDQAGRIERLAFRQEDPLGRRGLVWPQRIQVAIGGRSGMETLAVTLQDSTTVVADATGKPAPEFVLPTAGGIAYGGFALDRGSHEWLLQHLPELPDPLLRGAAVVTLWEEMLDGRAEPIALASLLTRSLPLERDELNVERMLGYLQQVWWRFLDPKMRQKIPIEPLLREGLDKAQTQSRKAAWFNALRDVATTEPTLAWLERVWRKTESVPGLELAEPDYVTLAQELALRSVDNADAILREQIARTQNPDRKARMEFVRPALSGDQKVRDAFFESLKDARNRRREAWVLEAVGYLHHPLRAPASEPYVRSSLELLREIQQTGDIFFPKRWMDATLAGHRTSSVARTVTAFLDALPPGYPDRLRRIVLSSSDDLLRLTATTRR
jgi:aminopeptidase N